MLGEFKQVLRKFLTYPQAEAVSKLIEKGGKDSKPSFHGERARRTPWQMGPLA